MTALEERLAVIEKKAKVMDEQREVMRDFGMRGADKEAINHLLDLRESGVIDYKMEETLYTIYVVFSGGV